MPLSLFAWCECIFDSVWQIGKLYKRHPSIGFIHPHSVIHRTSFSSKPTSSPCRVAQRGSTTSSARHPVTGVATKHRTSKLEKKEGEEETPEDWRSMSIYMRSATPKLKSTFHTSPQIPFQVCGHLVPSITQCCVGETCLGISVTAFCFWEMWSDDSWDEICSCGWS